MVAYFIGVLAFVLGRIATEARFLLYVFGYYLISVFSNYVLIFCGEVSFFISSTFLGLLELDFT
jgi:hypothetical protein